MKLSKILANNSKAAKEKKEWDTTKAHWYELQSKMFLAASYGRNEVNSTYYRDEVLEYITEKLQYEELEFKLLENDIGKYINIVW